MRSLLTALLLSLCCVLPLPASADAPPTRQDLQTALKSLADRKLPEAEHKPLQQALEQAMTFLGEQSESLEKLEALQAQLVEAPAQTRQAQADLQTLRNQPRQSAAERYAGLSPVQLEQRLNQRSLQLADWQKALSEANSLIITAQTRPERAQSELTANQTRLQQIAAILKSGRDGGRTLSSEARQSLLAEQAALEARNQLRRAELSGNSVLLDLGTARRALLDERIQRAEQDVLELQTLINEKRRALSEQTAEEISREAERTRSDRLLARESRANLELSDALLAYTEQLNEVTRQNLQVRRQLDSLTQNERALEEQVNALQGSLLLSRILYQQKRALPHVRPDPQLSSRIADLRLYQFEINQQREALGTPAAYVEQLLAEASDEEISAAERDTLLELAQTRSELLERLNRDLNSLLNESINLQLNQRQLQTTVETVQATLDEQIFWIPSNHPLGLDWFKTLPLRLLEQFVEMPWASSLGEFAAGLSERPAVFLPLLVLIGALLWRRRALGERLNTLHARVGHYRDDNQRTTPMAILLVLLLALPGSLLLALCGYALTLDARGQNASLGAAFFEMAQAWLVLYTAYRVLEPRGIAEQHFGWSHDQVAFLYRHMRRLGLVVLALVAVVAFAERNPSALAEDALGILIVISCFLLMSGLMIHLLRKGPASRHTPPTRVAVGILFALLPLVMIAAVGFGYYYTALKLTDRLIDTLYLMILWIGIEACLARSLDVAARRLAYQRALASREAQAVESAEGEVIETPQLDIVQVNQQSLRLVRLGLLAAFLASLYWVWADLISVFSYLDNLVLYQYTNAAGELTAISLNNLLGALLIVAVTIALARNLPGLLEVLVLSRLTLAPGSVYATTTLLSYAIIGLGFVLTLSTLGVTWDKLQWLVAALSVGIGFGMQAIFANFISGLILLFERPIRIGDLITIGTVTGTVKRIHIRATHITDSDRKAVIVPNQTFLTSQLINWTLTDTITRIVMIFNVNRGADLELTRRLMLQATSENPRVLHEPAASVQLKSYSPTTLEHELRVFVRELSDRSPVIDELNRRIDQLFQQHGINVGAVPKMEITLANRKGDERCLASGPLPPPDGKPADKPDPERSEQDKPRDPPRA